MRGFKRGLLVGLALASLVFVCFLASVGGLHSLKDQQTTFMAGVQGSANRSAETPQSATALRRHPLAYPHSKEEQQEDQREGPAPPTPIDSVVKEGGKIIGAHVPLSPDLLRSWSGAASEAELKAFFAEAQSNVTQWKRDLFGVTAKLHARHLHNTTVKIDTFFDILDPVISCPPGTTRQSIGPSGVDGSKWVCGLSELKEPCVVLSLGSRGNYNFEKDILAKTPCHVYTFDCTMGKMRDRIKELGARHKFHEKCIGSEAKAKEDPNFMSLPKVMDMLGVKRVDLFKMDIEGFEYDVMSTWGTMKESGLDYNYLPMQVLFEVHIGSIYFGTPFFFKDDLSNLMWPKAPRVTLPELALFFSHLTELGYAVAFQEKNSLCNSCSEFVLLRIK